jgi:hypothetical protein
LSDKATQFWVDKSDIVRPIYKLYTILQKLRKIKDLKYSIDSVNYCEGIPFFRKLRKVDFLICDKKIAEFAINKNQYIINFIDAEKMEIYAENKIGTEFKINDSKNGQIWRFFNPNKNFSFFKQVPDYLIKSNEIEIEINNRNGSFIYSIEKKLIGRIEDKNIVFKNGNYIIDILDENQMRIIISACCVEIIRCHILKIYEPL